LVVCVGVVVLVGEGLIYWIEWFYVCDDC